MSWNYRMTRREMDDGTHAFEIREVYYNEAGEIDGWTEDAVAPYGETAMELMDHLAKMTRAFGTLVIDLDTGKEMPRRANPSRRAVPRKQ